MNKKTWDLYAPIYQRAMKADQKIYDFMYRRIPDKVRDKEVLELATGPGLLAKHIAPAARSVLATDYSDGMIAEAKKGACPENLRFEVADAMALPYDDHSFDAVLIANALHIVPDPEKALSEIDRVLRPGGLLIFALYPALPDRPPISELQDFVQKLFMGPFTKLGKIFDLNRPSHMRLIDKVFRRSGNLDRKDIFKYPAGFVNVDAPYDQEHHAASYRFTQCPNAEFAKKHGLLHVLPLLCNSDFFGIGEIHGQLIRRGTCGNSDACDYLVVGSENPIAAEYETATDDRGFLVSRKRAPEHACPVDPYSLDCRLEK